MVTFGAVSAFLKRLAQEEAQDLVEYALIVALLAFGSAASMQTLSNNISSSFTKMSSAMTQNIT